jgi:hypothetical protein
MVRSVKQQRLRSLLLASFDIALFACGMGVVAVSPLQIAGDARSRYHSLEMLLTTGTFENTSYSLVGPVFAAPLWLLGKDPAGRLQSVSYFNLTVFALASLTLFWSLRRAVGSEPTRRFLLILLFASAYPRELQNFNNEVFSSVILGCACIGLALGRGFNRWLSAIGVVLATANMPGLAVGVALAMLHVVLHEKRVRWLLILCICALAILGEAWLRRGSPWLSGYEGNSGFKTVMPYSGMPGFSYPFFLGLLSILFSFGKGLTFFYPGLALPIRTRIPSRGIVRVYEMWILVVVGLILVYARWWAWYGGWCWGPRFFLFAAFPASFALTLWTRRARSPLGSFAVCLVTAWGFWTGFSGLVFGLSELDICTSRNYKLEALCWYVPEFSPLMRPLIVPRELVDWEVTALYVFVASYIRVTFVTWRYCIGGVFAAFVQAYRVAIPELRKFRV